MQKEKVKETLHGLYTNKHKWAFIMLACCIVLILLAVFVGSCVQTAGWSATVEDLRNAQNSGTITLTPTDDPDPEVANQSKTYTVRGSVTSGILFVPKKASEEDKRPAVVYTHGLYNNREMQLQNAIELVRRGYVVLVIDQVSHGHNTSTSTGSAFSSTEFMNAAKYLYNLPYVDQTRIGVSGHSMGGSATNNALRDDSQQAGSKTDANFKAGTHMGIISAFLTQANNAPSNQNIGSNVIAVGNIKASSDEFFYSSTLKENTYVPVAKNQVTEDNYFNYYLKKGDEYVKQTKEDRYRPSKTYYNFTNRGGPTFYLQSSQAFTFTRGTAPTETDDWATINGGIYANGKLVAEPNGKKLASVASEGKQIASVENSIRVVYEARETHPMNHMSTKSAAHIIDFWYNAFGTVEAVGYKAPTNQTWWLKETFAIFGFIGIFGMLIPLTDILLGTRLFASLKVNEEEVREAPVLLTKPRKHVSYWLSGILTAWFSAYSLKNMTANDGWFSKLGLSGLLNNTTEGFIYANIGSIAAWGMVCAGFGIAVTAVIWLINHCINVFVYKDDYINYDEHPFDGFKIRSWKNLLKTPLLAAILVGIFYTVINLIWRWTVVDFRFWTFDLRVFDLVRVPSMLKYVPYFFIFYMVLGVLGNNYSVKDLPEWATIAINAVFNVIGITILMWHQNDYFIRVGAAVDSGNNLFYIACYPIIPCVVVATIIGRRLYKRTGNAWLGGLVNALIMTFLACANTSVNGTVAWFYGA